MNLCFCVCIYVWYVCMSYLTWTIILDKSPKYLCLALNWKCFFPGPMVIWESLYSSVFLSPYFTKQYCIMWQWGICCRLIWFQVKMVFNLGWFVIIISLSLFMIMNTRDKEITDQPRLNHFDLKWNSTCNIILYMKLLLLLLSLLLLLLLLLLSPYLVWPFQCLYFSQTDPADDEPSVLLLDPKTPCKPAMEKSF